MTSRSTPAMQDQSTQPELRAEGARPERRKTPGKRTPERRVQRARDPQARRETLAAAAIEVIAEAGIGRTTHRAVAARAELPLGATTYYFPTLDDLIAAGLQQATSALQAELESWAVELRDAADLPDALTRLVAEYLVDRRRVRIEYELFVAAARDAALRPLAEAWLIGMREMLEPHMGAAAAQDVVALLDGVMLQVLITGQELDAERLSSAIRRLSA